MRYIFLSVFAVLNLFLLLEIAPRVTPQGTDIRNDIRYIYQDGHDIANGINPYQKIHGSNMRENQKYSTYFPGFFLFAAATVRLGFDDLGKFLELWRPLSILIHLSVGLIILMLFMDKGWLVAGIFSSLFYLYNRFTLSVMGSGQIDLLAILFLILALRKGNPYWFGVSLAVKQVAIFVVPLYLLVSRTGENFKEQLLSIFKLGLKVAVIPVLCSLPFIVHDAKAFIMSILFSATRSAGGLATRLRAKSVDHIMEWEGLLARLPMLAMMGLVAYLCYQRKLGLYSSTFIIFWVFVCFNSVLLTQYIVWGVAFLPLVLLEKREV